MVSYRIFLPLMALVVAVMVIGACSSDEEEAAAPATDATTANHDETALEKTKKTRLMHKIRDYFNNGTS